MFGRAVLVRKDADFIDLLTLSRCTPHCATGCDRHTMSKTEAKKLINSGVIRKTHVDDTHYVLTNKNGSNLYGFFKLE